MMENSGLQGEIERLKQLSPEDAELELKNYHAGCAIWGRSNPIFLGPPEDFLKLKIAQYETFILVAKDTPNELPSTKFFDGCVFADDGSFQHPELEIHGTLPPGQEAFPDHEVSGDPMDNLTFYVPTGDEEWLN